MLIIRKRQLDALKEVEEAKLAKTMSDYFQRTFEKLAERHPERLLVETIRSNFARARQYDFNDDEQVGKFALLAFVLGEDFDLQARNNFVLTEPLWDPAARLDYIIGWIEIISQADRRKQPDRRT